MILQTNHDHPIINQSVWFTEKPILPHTGHSLDKCLQAPTARELDIRRK